MRPQVHVPLAAADRAAASPQPRRIFAICALGIAALIAHSTMVRPQHSGAEEQALAPSCTQWHQAASEAVSRLAQSRRDPDLRRVNDAIFRMRRALRNCEEGWFRLACQDYYAVARGLPGYTDMNEGSLFACSRSAE